MSYFVSCHKVRHKVCRMCICFWCTNTTSKSVLLCRTLRPVTECDIKYVGCTVHQLVLAEIVLFHRSCLITPHPVQLCTSRRIQFRNTGQSTRGKTAACSANMCNVAGQARMTRTGRVQPPIRRGLRPGAL